MIAAENDAIQGAKVGGMADVIRDLPPALAKVDVSVDIAMPDYGFIAEENDAELIASVDVKFGANIESVAIFKMPVPLLNKTTSIDERSHPVSWIFLFQHHLFNSGDKQVYTEGSHDRPFAEDATKFALFNLAVAKAYVDQVIPAVDALHMHDWHAGILVMLRAFSPEYAALKTIPCVFSIHNLALQGIRPIRDDVSSFNAWFPELSRSLTIEQKAQIIDPRYPHCVNPMKMGIALSDKVHLVSPTYANEVLIPSDHPNGFYGGEGLEASLQDKQRRGDLVGILNGCVYDNCVYDNCDSDAIELEKSVDVKKITTKQIGQLLNQSQGTVLKWLAKTDVVKSVNQIALTRLQILIANQAKASTACDFVMTSVGRLTDQKVLLLRQPNDKASSILQVMLDNLKRLKPKAVFVLLGSGDKQIAKEFQQVAAINQNFVFLNGYDDNLATALYQYGELFMMPSSFEPCGISQLLAMKQGQVCIAHGVGGLRDTISDKKNGWLFEGNSLKNQSEQLLKVLNQALTLHNDKPDEYMAMRKSASKVRFTWHQSAKQYRDKLYRD